MLKQLEKQKWKCALTGIPMVLHCDNKTDRSHWNTVSADRINPNEGYIEGNVRFVIFQVNVFKGCNSDVHMYEIAQSLINNRAFVLCTQPTKEPCDGDVIGKHF